MPLDSDSASPSRLCDTDHAAISKLEATGEFSAMRRSVDEDEHSIEMHLPYIRKVFEGFAVRLEDMR